MKPILDILAIVGFLALVWGLGLAVLQLVRGGVDGLVAGGLAETRARRGDVTGMSEAERHLARARRNRVRSAAFVAGWAALLLVPPLTPWPRAIYGAAAVFWIVHVRYGRAR